MGLKRKADRKGGDKHTRAAFSASLAFRVPFFRGAAAGAAGLDLSSSEEASQSS